MRADCPGGCCQDSTPAERALSRFGRSSWCVDPECPRSGFLAGDSGSWSAVASHTKTENSYCKNQKNLDTRKICCNQPKILTRWLYCRVMPPKDADGMANSAGPDQTAPLGAI